MTRGLLWTVWLWASAAWAAGSAETYGHDVRSLGKASAVLADDSGAAAAFVNPAALARVRSPTLHAGFQLALPALHVDLADPRPPDDPLAPALPSPVAGIGLGFAAPLQILVDDRVYLGVTAYVPSAVLVRARAYDPARPSFYVYDAATEHYELFAGAAVRIVDWLQVGGGARLGAGQGGTTNLVLDPVQGRFTRQDIDTAQVSVLSPISGVLLGPLGAPEVKGRVAFVVRDRSSFDVTLPAALTLSGVDVSLLLDIVTLSNFSPRTWNAGLTLEILDVVNASIDVQYAQWSEAPSPFLRVTNDISGEGLERLGLGEALDAPAAGQDRVVSPGFVDTVNVRAGVEGALLGGLLTLRGGYAYRPTPVPDQTSGSNIVDNTTHTIALGAGVKASLPDVVDRPVQWNVSYQAHVLQPRTAEKASARDPVGSWTSSGVVHHVGIDVRYVW